MCSKKKNKKRKKSKQSKIKPITPSEIYASIVSKAPNSEDLIKRHDEIIKEKERKKEKLRSRFFSTDFGYILTKQLDDTIDTVEGTIAWWSFRVGKGYGTCEKKVFSIPNKDKLNKKDIFEYIKKPIPKNALDNAYKYRDFTYAYERLYDVNDIIRAVWINKKEIVMPTISFDIFPGIYNAPNGLVQMPKKNEKRLGGHCVSITGFGGKKERILYFDNSWGVGWGDKGRGYLPYAYANKYIIECWAHLHKTFWEKNNAGVSEEIKRGSTYRLSKCNSLVYGRPPLWILDVYKEQRIQGWAHLRLVEFGKVLEIEDLFVLPEFRGLGVGRGLIEYIDKFAEHYLVPTIRCYVGVHDLVTSERLKTVRKFFTKSSYKIKKDTSKFRGCYWKAIKQYNHFK